MFCLAKVNWDASTNEIDRFDIRLRLTLSCKSGYGLKQPMTGKNGQYCGQSSKSQLSVPFRRKSTAAGSIVWVSKLNLNVTVYFNFSIQNARGWLFLRPNLWSSWRLTGQAERQARKKCISCTTQMIQGWSKWLIQNGWSTKMEV